MSEVVYAVTYLLQAFAEIDETYHEKLPDGRLKVVFVTTALHPRLASIKAAVWALSGLPAQAVDEITVEELQAGPVAKRYRITMVLRPLIDLKKGEINTPRILDVLLGKNTKFLGD